jgi:hypothetical protein
MQTPTTPDSWKRSLNAVDPGGCAAKRKISEDSHFYKLGVRNQDSLLYRNSFGSDGIGPVGRNKLREEVMGPINDFSSDYGK